MPSRTSRRSIAALVVAASCVGLTACNNDTTVSSATSSTTSTAQSTSTSAPPESSTSSSSSSANDSPTSSASSTTATPEPPTAPAPSTDPGKSDTLGMTGGWIVSGSYITFVYRNGMRFVVDTGTTITNPTSGTYTSDKGTLKLTVNTATWTGKGLLARADVKRTGAGTVLDRSGAIAVMKDGSVVCATDKRIAYVGVDGRRGEANRGGAVFVDKPGKKTTIGKPADQGRMVGRYSVCNPGGRSSVEVFSDVLFDFNSDKLTPGGLALVKSAAATIGTEVKGKTVRIVGHTDSKGTPAANLDLGRRRAVTVSNELKRLIPGLQTEIRSAGQTQPTAPNMTPSGADNPAGRALNRRVEISWAQ